MTFTVPYRGGCLYQRPSYLHRDNSPIGGNPPGTIINTTPHQQDRWGVLPNYIHLTTDNTITTSLVVTTCVAATLPNSEAGQVSPITQINARGWI